LPSRLFPLLNKLVGKLISKTDLFSIGKMNYTE
jgi:hypothetical protein